MRFLGVHHLVYGLNHEQQRYRFLEYYLQSDFRDQIKSITNRHADVGVFDFPWGSYGTYDKDIYHSRFLGPSSDNLIASEYSSLKHLERRILECGFNTLNSGSIQLFTAFCFEILLGINALLFLRAIIVWPY